MHIFLQADDSCELEAKMIGRSAVHTGLCATQQAHELSFPSQAVIITMEHMQIQHTFVRGLAIGMLAAMSAACRISLAMIGKNLQAVMTNK